MFRAVWQQDFGLGISTCICYSSPSLVVYLEALLPVWSLHAEYHLCEKVCYWRARDNSWTGPDDYHQMYCVYIAAEGRSDWVGECARLGGGALSGVWLSSIAMWLKIPPVPCHFKRTTERKFSLSPRGRRLNNTMLNQKYSFLHVWILVIFFVLKSFILFLPCKGVVENV